MFLAPAFLLGLLAIGLPLWLHRVARANPTHQQFPSLMLLEASETQRTAKRTLRYWLLLLLRIALLVALAVAFAGPLIASRATGETSAEARLHAIVMDTSLSMQYGERWSHAIEQALKVIDELHAGDRVMLAAASGRKVSIVHEAVNARDAGSVRAALQGLKPGIDRLDYGSLMSTASSWLGSPRPATQLHLISDFQASGSPLRFADLAPPVDTMLVAHDVAELADHNAYIESAALTAKNTRDLEVEVKSSATKPDQRTMILRVDGKEITRKPVEIKPAAVVQGEGGPNASAAQEQGALGTANTTKVVFADLTLTPGAHRIELQLDPQDGLPQDDRYFAVIEHADPKVLVVGRDANADEAAYFGAAIGSQTAPHLTVEQQQPQVLESASLSGYSALAIADLNSLSSTASRRIRDYIVGGGAALATLGAGSAGDGNVLLEGLRIREVRNQPTRVGWVESSHPVLRDARDWHAVRFFRSLDVAAGPEDRVLIRLEDGSPLLLERTIGAGRLLLMTAPLDREWNDLAIHPLFVRFIAEATRYLTGQDAAATSASVGSVIMTGLTAAAGGQIFDPSGERVLDLAAAAKADRLIPQHTGFYEIRGDRGVRFMAVNVDARESDLRQMTPQHVTRWQSLRAAAEPTASTDSQRTPTPPTSAKPQSLGYFMLLLAALLIFFELLAANHHLMIRREVPR